MNIYHFDPSNGSYLGSSDADESPLEEDVFLIPANATDVAPTVFDPATQECVFADGAWSISNIPPPPTPDAPSLEQVKADKIAEINTAAESHISPITSAYSQAERDTWPIQEAEAAAWLANPSAATPMLTALATQRNMAMADLVASVQVKAATFKALAGAVFGKRRALIDQVDAATDANEVALVTWD